MRVQKEEEKMDTYTIVGIVLIAVGVVTLFVQHRSKKKNKDKDFERLGKY